jgi:antitoxin FitA
MNQFVVRQLEPVIKSKLKARAQRNGRSMEAEVREILRNVLAETPAPTQRLGTAIAGRFIGIGLDSPLPELRGELVRPAIFGLGDKKQGRK